MLLHVLKKDRPEDTLKGFFNKQLDGASNPVQHWSVFCSPNGKILITVVKLDHVFPRGENSENGLEPIT